MNARSCVLSSLVMLSLGAAPAVARAQSGFVRHNTTPAPQGPQPAATDPNATATPAPVAGVTVDPNAVVVAPPGAAADVPWEERTIRYTGGPIRPGMRLEERVNGPMVGGGAAAIAIGYAFSFVNISLRPIAAVPLVGPILAIGGVAAPADGTGIVEISGGAVAFWVISEVLQLGGAALFTAGFFMPKRTLVYDVPANAPRDPNTVPNNTGTTRRGWYGRNDRRIRWAITPGAPDASAGLSLTVTNF